MRRRGIASVAVSAAAAAVAAVLAAVIAAAVVTAAMSATAVVVPTVEAPVVGRAAKTAVPALPPAVPGLVAGCARVPPAAVGGSRAPSGIRTGVAPGTRRPTTAAAAARLPTAAGALAAGPLVAVTARAAAGRVVAAPGVPGGRWWTPPRRHVGSGGVPSAPALVGTATTAGRRGATRIRRTTGAAPLAGTAPLGLRPRRPRRPDPVHPRGFGGRCRVRGTVPIPADIHVGELRGQVSLEGSLRTPQPGGRRRLARRRFIRRVSWGAKKASSNVASSYPLQVTLTKRGPSLPTAWSRIWSIWYVCPSGLGPWGQTFAFNAGCSGGSAAGPDGARTRWTMFSRRCSPLMPSTAVGPSMRTTRKGPWARWPSFLPL